MPTGTEEPPLKQHRTEQKQVSSELVAATTAAEITPGHEDDGEGAGRRYREEARSDRTDAAKAPTAAAAPPVVTLEAIAQRMAACYVASPQYTRKDKGADTVAHFAKGICEYLEAFGMHPEHLQKIAACLVTCVTWKQMAERVLVMGGLLLQGREGLILSRSIDDVVNDCAAMTENRDTVIRDAFVSCNFQLSSLTLPGALTLGEIVANPEHMNEPIRRQCIGTYSSNKSLETRHLVKGGVLHAPPSSAASSTPSNVFDALQLEVMSSIVPRVIAVSGTSGSGKTIASLEAATRFARDDTSKPAVSTLYMLASDMSTINVVNAMVSDEEKVKNDRNKEAEKAILAVVKSLIKVSPAKDGRQKTTAVIVVDEVGDYANFVRGVCAARPFTAIQKYLNVDRVIVMVVGTGVDVATNAVGSLPESFVRAHVDSRSVSLCILRQAVTATTKTINEETSSAGQAGNTATVTTDVPPSPLELLLKECEAWRRALELAPRLCATLSDMSHNPRMMAALAEFLSISSTTYERDPANDLASRLERAVDYALEKFVMLNGLSSLNFDNLLAYCIRAFAMSLDSGLISMLHDSDCERVVRKYGLVADLAEWCTRDTPDIQSRIRFGEPKRCDGVEYVLCLRKGRTYRYEMSPAVMALSFRLFGRRYPEWSGEGFERTLAEYLSWVLLAAHSGVPITIAEADPLAPLKRLLVSMGLEADANGNRIPWIGDATLWRVVLEERVKTVEAAATILTTCVRAVTGRHLVVALNAPLAPFADILIGLVEFQGGAATVRSMVLIQAKHLPGNAGTSLAAVLSPLDCYRELAKMGYVSLNTTVATAVDALNKNKLHRSASALVRLGYDVDTLNQLQKEEKQKCLSGNSHAPNSLKGFLGMFLPTKLAATVQRHRASHDSASSDCMWMDDPSTMLQTAGLRAVGNETTVDEVAIALGHDAAKGSPGVSPPDGRESESPLIPKTAWFIVLRSPGTKSMVKDAAHPEELLWFNDLTARDAFSPSSLGKFIVIKKHEIAPLNLRAFRRTELE